MFGLSTELITKSKLVTVRNKAADISSVSPLLHFNSDNLTKS